MLSHKVLTRQDVGRAASYYEDGADDYYAKDGEASAWQGKGAEVLGLEGPVDQRTVPGAPRRATSPRLAARREPRRARTPTTGSGSTSPSRPRRASPSRRSSAATPPSSARTTSRSSAPSPRPRSAPRLARR